MKKNILLAFLFVIVGGMYLYLFSRNTHVGLCHKHEIPIAQCPFCDSSLIAKQGECRQHRVSEALCYQCNPILVKAFKAKGDWCAGHNVPESQCYLCNPHLQKKSTASVSTKKQRIRLLESLPRNRRKPSVDCNKHNLQVQFLSPQITKDVGIETTVVERKKVTQTLSCNAQIDYDQNNYVSLASRVEGTIVKVSKDLGDRVVKGDVLAIIECLELGTAKAEYLKQQVLMNLWQKNTQREEKLFKRNISTEKEFLEAQTKFVEVQVALSQARQKLRLYGLSEEEIDKVAREKDTTSFFSLVSPFAGVIVARSAVMGKVVDTSNTLFSISDISKMWAIIDIYEDDVGHVTTGQKVILQINGIHGESFAGRITWVSSQIDPHTRTMKVRAEIKNLESLLKANMFGTAIVKISDGKSVPVVPKTAVQWDGCCNIVFVYHSDMLYKPKKVWLGYETENYYVVKKGVDVGEAIVTQGSFLLKTEILKGSIGAGCCEANPGQ